MSEKMNLLVFLNTYSDTSPTNAPKLNCIKRTRGVNGVVVGKSKAEECVLAPGETRTLFDGSRTLLQDLTTQYTLALKPLTSNTYVLSWAGGTAPAFRTARTTGASATTEITVTSNGPTLTLASTGGTPLALIAGGAVAGDEVRIGSLFNVLNQGHFTILSLTATSVTVKNEVGVAEGPVVLGSGFSQQFQVYSQAGVQIGDTIKISGGFSPVSRRSFSITDVAAGYLEFYSTDALPQEGPVTTNAISIYSQAKNLVYVEADRKCGLTINGVAAGEIEPFVIGSSTQPGIFIRKSLMWQMSITNLDSVAANIYMAAVE
jgi:hypothetical protein